MMNRLLKKLVKRASIVISLTILVFLVAGEARKDSYRVYQTTLLFNPAKKFTIDGFSGLGGAQYNFLMPKILLIEIVDSLPSYVVDDEQQPVFVIDAQIRDGNKHVLSVVTSQSCASGVLIGKNNLICDAELARSILSEVSEYRKNNQIIDESFWFKLRNRRLFL
jgi:hypothetical protein